MLDAAPWTRPSPPPVPVLVIGTFGERCPAGFRRVGPDRSGQLGCVIDWTCAVGTNGRSPAEGASMSIRGDHVVIDSDGFIRDVDNGVPCAMDAWGRKVCAGEIREVLWEGRPEKWWAQVDACDPVACGPEPTPAPTTGPPGTPVPPGACPPLHLVQWDVLRIASKVDRSTQPRTGGEGNPALADEDIIVGHITPKMLRPYCPNERIICEMAPACQDERVGRPVITQTLPGVFDRDPVVQNSGNAFITFMNLAPGEVGRFEIEACTEWGTHCTTSYVWVR